MSNEIDLHYMMLHYDNNLTFDKAGKNKYKVLHEGKEVGFTSGQSRYWYLKAYSKV